jgi:hypothetical protein
MYFSSEQVEKSSADADGLEGLIIHGATAT